MNTKRVVLGFLLILCLGLASAALDISEENVKDVVITELGEPAIFNLQITNTGAYDSFEIYSLVSGIDIKPRESFVLTEGETRTIQIEVYFDKKVLKDKESISFEYRIAGQNSGVTKNILSVKVYTFETAFSILCEDIKLSQKEATINIKNNLNYAFENLNIKLSSEFFDESFNVNLIPLEKKSIKAELDQEKLSLATAGSYILSTEITSGNSSGKAMSIFNFEETTDLQEEESGKGLFIRKTISRKTNQGSTPSVARVVVKKDVLSMLFTTSNLIPSEKTTEGLITTLVFEKELQPSESFYVEVRTNYYILMILAVLVVVGAYLFVYNIFGKRNLLIKKRVAIVKTKRGEFALKVTLYVKALRPIKRVSIIESIPRLVKLYNRFGVMRPTRIDAKDRRVEWDFEALGQEDERVLSYIIYSRIGVFGEFYLPATTGLYEDVDGKIYETESNKIVLRFDNVGKEDKEE